MQSTDRRMPDLGPNPIHEALQNYQQMAHDLGLAREELAAKGDMVNDLLRENEFLRRNYDKAVAERDRYQALAVNLATRAVGVREAVERLLTEAVSARAAPVEEKEVAGVASLTDELTNVLNSSRIPNPSSSNPADWFPPKDGVFNREITRRTTLAPNEFR